MLSSNLTLAKKMKSHDSPNVLLCSFCEKMRFLFLEKNIVYSVSHEGGFGVKAAALLDLQHEAGTIFTPSDFLKCGQNFNKHEMLHAGINCSICLSKSKHVSAMMYEIHHLCY